MTTDHRPLSDAIAEAFPVWRESAPIVGTFSGSRYRAGDVARLLSAPLTDAGFRRGQDAAANDTFVLDDECWPIERLRAYLLGALTEHPDRALRASLRMRGPYEEVLPYLPLAGLVTPAPAPSDALVRDVVGRITSPTPASRVYDTYAAAARAVGATVLGRYTFNARARATGLVEQRRRRSGFVFLPIER